MMTLIDVVCPACRAVNGCLLPGETLGVRCRKCSVDFVAKIVGREQKYCYGEQYQRSRPSRVTFQADPLLPQGRETIAILPVPGVTIDA